MLFRSVEICNWEERKLLITWPNVAYWLSWLPWNCLRETFAQMCCDPDRKRQVPWLLTLMLVGALFRLDCRLVGRGVRAESAGRIATERFAVRAMEAAGPEERIERDALSRALAADDLVQHLLGEGENLVLGAAADAPPWAAVASNLLSGSALGTVAGAGGLAALNRRLGDLQERLAAQQKAIDELQKR